MGKRERERRRKCKKRKGKKWRRSCPYGPRIEGTSSLSPIPFPLLPFCARIASKMRRGVAKPCWNEGGGRRTRLPGTPVIRWSSFHMILRIGHPSSAPPLLPPPLLPPVLAAEGRKKMQSALTVMKKNRLRVIRMNDASSSSISSIVSTYVRVVRTLSLLSSFVPLPLRDRNHLNHYLGENRWTGWRVIASLSYFSTNRINGVTDHGGRRDSFWW